MNSVLTQPEDVQAVFRDSDKHIKAFNNNSGWLMGQILGKCVGLINYGDWQTLRAVTEIPFLHQKIQAHIARIELHTEGHFDNLHMHGRLNQGLINPVNDLKMLPFWIIAEIIYGHLSPSAETMLKSLIPLRESLFRRMISGGLTRFWWSQYLPTNTNRELVEFKEKWSAFNDAAYQISTASGSDSPIVEMYEAVRSGKIDREQLLQTIDEILFANLDVTIGAISWNLLFLAAFKDIQTALRTEIRNRRRATEAGGQDWQQYLLSSSTLLAASISESSRLKPLAAFSVPQAAPTDRASGGFIIPAGTNIVVDSYALNIRNPYWGSDSTLYRPERFLERKPTANRYHFWRFGFGPRTCMGKYVADAIIRVLLVHLLEHYELDLVARGDRENWEKRPETWITHPSTDVRCEKLSNPRE